MNTLDVLWVVLGIALLAVTMIDVFLAVLNYEEGGLFVHRFVRLLWVCLRGATRRVGRRWRPLVLRQVTGVLVLATILLWISGIVLGFAFIYFGAMGAGTFQISKGVSDDFLGAVYLSLGQFSTVGVDNIDPGIPVLELMTVAEALVSVVMISLIISFLSSVYGVIQSLRALSSNFFRIGYGIGDPIDTLEPFFPAGEPRGIDAQLGSILDSLNAYADGLAQNEAAYYFQSGRDQFALPFALDMTAGVVGALRWGLPTGSDMSQEPGLVRLGEAFEDLRLRLVDQHGWSVHAAPAPVTRAEFDAAVTTFTGTESNASIDAWVLRFLTVGRRMAELTRSTEPIDVADAYVRYREWLPFTFGARSFVAAISSDLDYQPIYRDSAATPDGTPLPRSEVPAGSGDATAVPARRRRTGGLRAWAHRTHLFLDPGWVRLADAIRTLVAVTVAVVIVVPIANAMGGAGTHAAVFAGLVALFAAPLTMGAGSGPHRWAGVIAIVPAVVGIAIGLLVPRNPVWTVVVLALVAALAAWVRRFGPRIGGLGQLMFVVYYFTLLLGEGPTDAAGLLVAAGVGLVTTALVNLVPGPDARRLIDGGLGEVYERVALLLDTTIDIVSTGRRDRRLTNIRQGEQQQLQRATTTVTGQLGSHVAGITSARAHTLRLRVFDVQLAAENMVNLLPIVSDVAIAASVRARLAADMVEVQDLLAGYRPGGSRETPPPFSAKPPRDWPRDARRMRAAILELRAALEHLRRTERADDAAVAADASAHRAAPGTQHPSSAAKPDREARVRAGRAADRQAAQAGVSTGLALFLGGFVSTSHQFWAAMPAFQVLSGSDGETRVKAFQRILATILGSGVAFGLAIVAGHNPYVAFPLLIVSVFFMSFLRPVSTAWTTFWQTLLLAAMYDVTGVLSVESVQVRVAETAIGAVVAAVVSTVLLPTRTRNTVLRGMAQVVDRAKGLADAAFARALDPAAPATDLAAAQSVGQQLSSLERITAPQRRNPGALQRSGVEVQLTSLWSLLYHEEHLARALRDNDDGVRAAVDWAKLRADSDENFAAVQAVLRGELPTRVRLPADFDVEPRDGAPAAVGAAVIEVQRINQSLLTLMDAVEPDTVATMTGTGASLAASETAPARRSS